MNRPTISIAEALAQSQITVDQSGKPNYFSITFIKDDGQRRHIQKASRNIKKGKTTKGAHTNLQQQNLMLLYDHDTATHKYITISLITHFNGTRVFH